MRLVKLVQVVRNINPADWFAGAQELRVGGWSWIRGSELVGAHLSCIETLWCANSSQNVLNEPCEPPLYSTAAARRGVVHCAEKKM